MCLQDHGEQFCLAGKITCIPRPTSIKYRFDLLMALQVRKYGFTPLLDWLKKKIGKIRNTVALLVQHSVIFVHNRRDSWLCFKFFLLAIAYRKRNSQLRLESNSGRNWFHLIKFWNLSRKHGPPGLTRVCSCLRQLCVWALSFTRDPGNEVESEAINIKLPSLSLTPWDVIGRYFTLKPNQYALLRRVASSQS